MLGSQVRRKEGGRAVDSSSGKVPCTVSRLHASCKEGRTHLLRDQGDLVTFDLQIEHGRAARDEGAIVDGRSGADGYRHPHALLESARPLLAVGQFLSSRLESARQEIRNRGRKRSEMAHLRTRVRSEM
jgi:hypothetical protein